MSIKSFIKRIAVKFKPVSKIYLGKQLYKKYSIENKSISLNKFMLKNYSRIKYISGEEKTNQIRNLFNSVCIEPIENNSFFYSIDCFKSMEAHHQLLINYSIDYSLAVNSSLDHFSKIINTSSDGFSDEENEVIEAIDVYITRCENTLQELDKYKKALLAVKSIKNRQAKSFYEALQRILFVNQLLWQTDHKHNGLGRLDVILDDLYKHDLESGIINREQAFSLIEDFMKALHSYYWFKSGMLLGDTGQIIILGGIDATGNYFCNELTKMFIEASIKLQLPDPKVFLRCSYSMPEDILSLALRCISTGIGAPFLSNDDRVIPAMLSFGYDEYIAYDYCASACWEPLAIHNSSDLNNIKAFNFARPFVEMTNDSHFDSCKSEIEILNLYKKYLDIYIDNTLKPLESLKFERDPLLTLFCSDSLFARRDITRGGTKYCNLGVTTVGMCSVVDSIIAISTFVFDSGTYTLKEMNEARKNNFSSNNTMYLKLKNMSCGFGSDNAKAIKLTNSLLDYTSRQFNKYRTYYGGKIKFGLSSPFYITDSRDVGATFDGRKEGDPFTVHISSNKGIEPTSLINFASKLDYHGNRLNGNVVDFFSTPTQINNNFNKYLQLIQAAFKQGVFQIQMNVVDSSTLIDAKKHPENYQQLIVRVWGFSAYFNDLPVEYQDVLINRALLAEGKAA